VRRGRGPGLRAALRRRFFSQDKEVIENLLGQLIVIEQRAFGIGHDEFVSFFAVAHGERIIFVVFDEADDFELNLRAFVRFDDE
jgi:hypothetical protein